jgi:hypothetical protein
MKINLKLILLIVIFVLIVSSVYIIFLPKSESIDNKPPEFIDITGDISAKKGDTINIIVKYSDNIEVTSALLYYKTISESEWTSKPIINGSVELTLNSKKDINYYATIDDAAKNGPIGNPSADGSSYYTISVHEDEDNTTEYIRHVLVEEGASNNCKFCPIIAEWLYDLYDSGEYNFYFVTLVYLDEKAANRLDNELNLWGLPTVFIDGGYKVLLGGGHEKTDFAQAIRDAELREVPNIQLTVEAEYDNTTENMVCNVLINNKDSDTYSGRIRVYLTEKISRWSGPEGDPYHFGFVDFLINEEISVKSNENVTFQKERDISNLDPENLMVIGAVFNSEKNQGYSDPPNNRFPFDAYYADAADGSELLSGGNLPPSVGFSVPKVGYMHIMGIPIWDYLFRKPTVLVGRTKIVAEAFDEDSEIEKVAFYIDDNLVGEDTEEPYEYTFRKVKLFKRILRNHTLTVIAYDDEGKTGTNSIDVRCYFL